MFKLLFKQNRDSTLQEKGWGLYRLGRISSLVVLIGGTLLSFIFATWVSNALQTALALLFSLGHADTGDLFSFGAMIHNEYLLSSLTFGSGFFAEHGKMVASLIRILGFVIPEWFVCRGALDMFVKTRNLNHNEMGASRIATPQEVAKETNKVPDRAYGYNVPSGAIMMHKMNFRGMINKMVKQQLFGLKGYFNLIPKPADSKQMKKQKALNYKNFCTDNNAVTITICGLLIIGGLVGGGQTVAGGTAPWYSPYYFWLFLYNVFHFIVRGLFNIICIGLPKLQWDLLKGLITPSFPIALIGLIFEALGLGLIGYRILASLRTEYRFNSATHEKGHAHGVERILNVLKPSYDAKHYKDALEYPFVHIYHAIKHPTVTSHPFFKKPILAVMMAFMKDLNDWLPLEHGITGWYYMSAGSATQQNQLIYGITRSGKGQMLVNVLGDINSRSAMAYRKNLIFNDPKLELAAGLYETYKKRGYDVKVLNIHDTSHSMSYNPLTLVINLTELGDVGQAAQQCSELSSTIYDATNQGGNAYFYKSAASLFDSIVFAQLALAHSRYYGLDDFVTKDVHGTQVNVREDGKAEGHLDHNGKQVEFWIERDKNGKAVKDKNGEPIVHGRNNAYSKVTINNILQMTTQLGGETAGSAGPDASNQLILYFQHIAHHLNKLREKKQDSQLSENLKDQLNILDQATQKFQQSKMAGKKTAGSIYSTFLERLRIYQQPDIARMTSMNNYNIEEFGFDRLFTIQFNRAYRLQNIVVESYDVKCKQDSYGNIIKDHNGNDEFDLDSNGNPQPDYDNMLERTGKTHLSDIGLAKIPFDNELPHDIFFLKINIYDEIVNKYFHFLIQCNKVFYDRQSYEKIDRDYRTAPKVASLEETDAKGRPVEKLNNGRYETIKHHHAVKASDIKVRDKYTHDRVLERVDMKTVKEPVAADYRREDGSLLPGKLGNLTYKPTKAIRMYHFLDNPRPTALFLGTSTDNQELNQLATFLIDQTFNVLSNYALRFTKHRKIQRPLQMILDELGNIPAIPHLDEKFSIGLSQGIEFVAVFQNKEQIINNYGKDKGNSVISNCSTTYYILSKSEDTIKAVSQAFGTRTVTTTSLNHDPTRISSANYNSSETKQAVMPEDRLRRLKVGETAILRSNDRQTVWGKETRPWPLFDTGRYILPYSFWFLNKYIRKGSINNVPVVTPHKYLDLEAVTIQFNKVYGWLENKENLDRTYLKNALAKISDKVNNAKFDPNYKKAFKIQIEAINIELNDQSTEGTTVLHKITNLAHQVNFYRPLTKLPTFVQAGRFALGILVDIPKIRVLTRKADISQLESIDTGHHTGGSILNISQLANTTHEMIQPADLAKGLYRLKGLKISGNNQSNPNSRVNSNFYGVASDLNVAFNSYLVDRHIIEYKDNRHQQKATLTKTGRAIINGRQGLINTILTKYPVDYEPRESLAQMMSNIIGSIATASTCKVDQNAYGFALMLAIINEKSYDDFCHYKDSSGVVQTLRAKPYIYFSGILTLLDAIISFKVSNTSDDIQANFAKMTKPCIALLRTIAKQDENLRYLLTGSTSPRPSHSVGNVSNESARHKLAHADS